MCGILGCASYGRGPIEFSLPTFNSGVGDNDAMGGQLSVAV
jgi:hypothetical protein